MMYGNWWNNYPTMMNQRFFDGFFGFFLVPLLVWSLLWKGWALWRAAKNDSKGWFVALLLINTAGILDILYIFVFGKEKKSRKR